MKFTGLIASTLMLLLAVMASTASARSIAFPEPQNCCRAYTAKCMSCSEGVTVEEFCRTNPYVPECPKPCCNALRADCEACKYGVTVEEICRVHEEDMALDSYLQPLEGCPKKPKKCCRANTLECQACNAGVSEDEFCRRNPHSHVCPQKPTKPSHPDNCYSTIWNTEIMHGEMGARKCCWYGKWEKKFKCEKNPLVTHPDNCYSTIWNTEIMHGEMGAKKCCWYGKWNSKSKCNGGQKDD